MRTWTVTATNVKDPSDLIRASMDSDYQPTQDEMASVVFSRLNERGARVIPDAPRGTIGAALLLLNGYSLSEVSELDGSAN
jgi:hypothetical protein